MKTKVAVIGSGNIGTDLMVKVIRTAKHLEMAAMDRPQLLWYTYYA